MGKRDYISYQNSQAHEQTDRTYIKPSDFISCRDFIVFEKEFLFVYFSFNLLSWHYAAVS